MFLSEKSISVIFFPRGIYGIFACLGTPKNEIPKCLSNNFLSIVDKIPPLAAPAQAYDHHQNMAF